MSTPTTLFWFQQQQLLSSLYFFLSQITSNGLVSFGQGVADFAPKAFPLRIPILAVFWTDLTSMYNDGKMIYRSLLRNPDTEDVYAHADEVVRQAFGNKLNFRASWMLIATWYNVSYLGELMSRVSKGIELMHYDITGIAGCPLIQVLHHKMAA